MHGLYFLKKVQVGKVWNGKGLLPYEKFHAWKDRIKSWHENFIILYKWHFPA